MSKAQDEKPVEPKARQWNLETIWTVASLGSPIIGALIITGLRFAHQQNPITQDDLVLAVAIFSLSLLIPVFAIVQRIVVLMNKQADQINLLRDQIAEAVSGNERLAKEQLEKISTALSQMAPLLEFQFKQGVLAKQNPYVSRLISQQRSDLTHAVNSQEITIRGRKYLIDEALFLTEQAKKEVVAKNHVPAGRWLRDTEGMLLPNYLDNQLKIAERVGIKIRRIHIYDEADLVKWDSVQWKDLRSLAERHKSPHEFLLCEKSQERATASLMGKGLVVPDLGDEEAGAAYLLFHLPEDGIQDGSVIYNHRKRSIAVKHMQELLAHAPSWAEFENTYKSTIEASGNRGKLG